MKFPCPWQSDVYASEKKCKGRPPPLTRLPGFDRQPHQNGWNILMLNGLESDHGDFWDLWHFSDRRLWRVLQNTSLLNSHVSCSALKALIGFARCCSIYEAVTTYGSQVDITRNMSINSLLVLVYPFFKILVGLVVTTVAILIFNYTMNQSTCLPDSLYRTGWWFQICFIFIHTWGRFPFWLILFKGVETTNQRTLKSKEIKG